MEAKRKQEEEERKKREDDEKRIQVYNYYTKFLSKQNLQNYRTKEVENKFWFAT